MNLSNEERQTILRQIGRMNVLAISGGRVTALPDGVELPVGYGYSVRVRYNRGGDDYTVQRVFKRAGVEFDKGSREGVYCDEVGNFAYYASCFRNDSGVWEYMG